jgi:glycosyl transferase family 25
MESEKNRANDLNRLFPCRVCINLDRRPDRWSRMEKMFARHNISTVQRFSGIDGQKIDVPLSWKYSRGAYGCLQSHLAIVKRTREERIPAILIFEDDCVFDHEFNEKVLAYISQVPLDWDLLFLGGWHQSELLKVSANISRSRNTWLAHAYALKHTLYDAFIEHCERGQEAVDHYLAMLQKHFNCYCCVPDLVWQQGEDSDIWEENKVVSSHG